jgi:DNA-binding beta-propeller fold protein YncE
VKMPMTRTTTRTLDAAVRTALALGAACCLALASFGCGGEGASTAGTPPQSKPVGGVSGTSGTPSQGSATPAGMAPAPAMTPAPSMSPATLPGMGAGMPASPSDGAMPQGSPAAGADAVMGMPAAAPPPEPTGEPTLFWLDITGGGIYRAPAADPASAMRIAQSSMAPDGIAVDVEGGKVYWTNMGSALGGAGNASLQRANLDGSQVETIIAPGTMGFNTGKQLTIDKINKHLYFADREGTTIWRADFDGQNMTPLVRRSSTPGHDFQALVGIAVDPPNAMFYFTDKDARKIRRAGYEPKIEGETPENRTDIEELETSGAGSGPIDLHLDLEKRLMYWTDRYLGQVLVAGMDLPAGQDVAGRDDIKILQMGVTEAIGIAIDETTRTAYVTQVSGIVSKFSLDGGMREMISRTGSTGIAFVHLP